jgi:release factor glutamine methyltransferase
MNIRTNKISDIRQYYLKELSEIYQPQESAVFLDILFEELLGLSRPARILNPGKRVTESEILKIHFAVGELKKQRPIQYILKKTEFYGLPFFVDESVLIPRPETEELVEWIILEATGVKPSLSILDIGTGSGCIAVSIKVNLTFSDVWAMDISKEALAVAKKNAISNHTGIHFLHHDISSDSSPKNIPRFNLIVSNPPYVRNSEKLRMQKNVLNYEPALALFVSDEDPLKFYRAISAFSMNHLKPGGFLFLEINEAFAGGTTDLLESAGFSGIIIKQDINGRDRMIKAVKF